MIPSFYNLSQKTEAEKGILPDLFFEANTALIPKPKTLQGRELKTKVSHEQRCEGQHHISKSNPTIYTLTQSI